MLLDNNDNLSIDIDDFFDFNDGKDFTIQDYISCIVNQASALSIKWNVEEYMTLLQNQIKQMTRELNRNQLGIGESLKSRRITKNESFKKMNGRKSLKESADSSYSDEYKGFLKYENELRSSLRNV